MPRISLECSTDTNSSMSTTLFLLTETKTCSKPTLALGDLPCEDLFCVWHWNAGMRWEQEPLGKTKGHSAEEGHRHRPRLTHVVLMKAVPQFRQGWRAICGPDNKLCDHGVIMHGDFISWNWETLSMSPLRNEAGQNNTFLPSLHAHPHQLLHGRCPQHNLISRKPRLRRI